MADTVPAPCQYVMGIQYGISGFPLPGYVTDKIHEPCQKMPKVTPRQVPSMVVGEIFALAVVACV